MGTVDDDEGTIEVEIEVFVVEEEDAAEDVVVKLDLYPLQTPLIQVLRAHWESLVQVALKPPQIGTAVGAEGVKGGLL